jgi:hypothetical protein
MTFAKQLFITLLILGCIGGASLPTVALAGGSEGPCCGGNGGQ